MRWHVNCFIWLMLFTIYASGVDRVVPANSRRPVKRSVNQFDEVADFADVIEPENNEQPVRREARPSLFEPVVDSVETSSPNSAPKKRSVSKKYSNLLDLKYYYSRGLPVRRHLNYDALPEENKRDSEEGVEKKSDTEMDGKSKRNSPLNILPIISDQNPYISGLADATNDAYLKMRNYAATLMVILTTTRRPSVRLNAPQALDRTESIRSPVVGNVGVSEEKKVGQVRDINGVLRNPKRKQRKEIGGRQKTKRRVVKKDVFSFVNTLNQPAAFQDISNAPEISTASVANIPMTDSVRISATTNPAPIQQATVAPQNYIPAVATIRESNVNQKEASPVNNVAIKHLEGTTTMQNQPQLKHVAVTRPHITANPGRPHLAALSKPMVPKSRFLAKEEKKETTENPFLWENNLLKEANIKVKRTMKPQETVLENQGRVAADERKDIPIVTDTKHLEISSKMLTSQPSTGNSASSCVINKAPESDDEQCNEEDDEVEEECGMEAMVNNTCGGLSPEAKKRRQGDSGDKQLAIGLSTSRKLRLARNANNNAYADRKRASPNKQDRTTHNSAHNNTKNRRSRPKAEKTKKQISCGLMFSINKSLSETNDNFSSTATTLPGANLTNFDQPKKQTMPSKIVAATTPLARLVEIPTLSFGLKGLGRFTGKKGKGKGTTPASASKGGGKKDQTVKMKKKVTPSHHTTEYVPEKQMLPLDFDARRLGHPKQRKGKSRAKSTTPKDNVAMTKGKHASKMVASSTPFAQLKENPTLGFAAILHSTKSGKHKSSGGASTPLPATTIVNTISLQCMIIPKNAAASNSTTNERIQKRH